MTAARRLPPTTVLGTLVALAVGLAGTLPAQDTLPSRPPAPTALTPVRFPPFQEARLSNGLTLLVVEHHEQPTVSVTLGFGAGSRYDPEGREGLADLAAELLTKGTPTRSAEQIAATIEGVGASLSASAGMDFFTVGTSVLTAHLETAFALLADVVRNATVPAEELELARTRYLSQLQLEMSQPEAVAARYFARELYGSHPYGRRATPASYRTISREDVQSFLAQRLRPRDALLVVAGDLTMRQARALVERHLAGWRGAPTAVAEFATPAPKRNTDILLIHRPGSVQANIVLGNTTMLPTDPNYYAARVATQVLGGGADARLFLILREQKSWTYGAYASLARYKGLGFWQATAETRTAVADSALTEVLRQVDRMRSDMVPDSELTNVRGFLVGSFPLSIETPQQIANQVASVRRLGLPDDYLRNYRDRLAAVTASRARDAAAATYRRDGLTIVVVGDATQLRDRLAAIAPVRLADIDGNPLTPDDLAPKAVAVALDRAQIVSRTDSFNVVIQGNVLGSQVWSVTATADSLLFRERLAIAAAGVSQQTTVRFDPASATVRQVDQTGGAAGQTSEIHLTYADGHVRGTSVTPQPTGTPKSLTIDTTIAADTYDDNALPLVITALPLEVGKTLNVSVFSSNDATVKVMTVKVGPPESVTVPAGAFEAYRLDVSGGQAPYVFHVTTATPRRIVKVEIVGAPFVFELAK